MKAREENKMYSYRGKKVSLVSSSEPLREKHDDWTWLDPEIDNFIKSNDRYRDFVLEDFTIPEIMRLRTGVKSRISQKFKNAGVKITSKSFFDDNRQVIQLKLQLVKKDKI